MRSFAIANQKNRIVSRGLDQLGIEPVEAACRANVKRTFADLLDGRNAR